MTNSTDTTSAIMASDQCVWRLDSQVCQQCEGVCWSIEGWAEGKVGNSFWRTTIAWATHVDQSVALSITARAIGRNADKVRAREISATLLELQQTLW